MVAVFLLQKLVRWELDFYFDILLYYFALVPILVWKKYFLWQWALISFSTEDLPSSLQSLGSLDVRGRVRKLLGIEKILAIFFLLRDRGRDLHGYLHSALYQFIPVIGASGAIYGLLLAYGWLFPTVSSTSTFSSPSLPNIWSLFRPHRTLLFHRRNRRRHRSPHPSGWPSLRFHLLAYPVIRQKIRREYYKRKWSQRGPGDRDYYH